MIINSSRDGGQQPRTRFLAPIPPGWALQACADLDAAQPGFLRAVMEARAVRRQAVMAAIARELTGLGAETGLLLRDCGPKLLHRPPTR